MKKLIIFLGVVLFVAVGCKEQHKEAANVVLHKQHFEEGTETPINGERSYYKESGDLKKKAVFVEGYPKTVISYYPNQKKRTKLVIADEGRGKIYHTEWYKSGQKKFEFTQGYIKEWYHHGQQKSEAHYDNNGDLHGIAKTWDKEGALKGQEEYEHGKLIESS